MNGRINCDLCRMDEMNKAEIIYTWNARRSVRQILNCLRL